jgi:hypothetical protein
MDFIESRKLKCRAHNRVITSWCCSSVLMAPSFVQRPWLLFIPCRGGPTNYSLLNMGLNYIMGFTYYELGIQHHHVPHPIGLVEGSCIRVESVPPDAVPHPIHHCQGAIGQSEHAQMLHHVLFILTGTSFMML